MFKISTDEKGLILHFECDESLSREVVTDEQRIRQVLFNLL
jgi:signal transduction histidine kinase